MLREIIGKCKTCGKTAHALTRKKEISEKDKVFECNDCTSKRWQKKSEQKKK